MLEKSSNKEEIIVPEIPAPERIDRYLQARLPDISRSQIHALIRENSILLNGKSTKKSVFVDTGDTIFIAQKSIRSMSDIPAENRDLDIVYENDSFIVVNKPARMNTHPTPQRGGNV